ncbi:hypothetical protein SDC9_65451 [bioreactor metagenome]|uniref:Uncharacterized protein n=1 Tax=bioreactor metagenome TaxID=1076179 RepID=A0A644XXL9_9ZZZZ
MCLPADGAVRHGTCTKPLHDVCGRLHLRNVNRIPFVIEHIPYESRIGFIVHRSGIFFKQAVVVGFGCNLQTGNSFGVPGMVFPVVAVSVNTQVLQARRPVIGLVE